MSTIFEFVEPKAYLIDDVLFGLVERLCVDARKDRLSPRYLFAYNRASHVEGVRRLVNELDVGSWRTADECIRLSTGHRVLVGAAAVDARLARAVVFCSGAFPDPAALTMMSTCSRVTLVIDPLDAPLDAPGLRGLALR